MSILPPFTPIYPFKGFQDCFDIIQQAIDQYDEGSKTSNPFIGFDIDGPSFLTYFENGEENMLSLSWEIYDHTDHILRIKMTSSEHEIAKGTFTEIFSAWHRGHSRDRLVNTGEQSVRSQNRITKRADTSWRPEYPPGGRGYKWPTIAVEVAWSERRPKVKDDMEFWLANSRGKVVVALSITVTRTKIAVERWELESRNDGMIPHPTEKMEILRKAKPNCPRIQGHLKIPFEDIYLRRKQKDETDFVLTEDNMEEMARKVWQL